MREGDSLSVPGGKSKRATAHLGGVSDVAVYRLSHGVLD